MPLHITDIRIQRHPLTAGYGTLSIEGRGLTINGLRYRRSCSLPPTPHPVEVFRGAQRQLIVALEASRLGYLEKPVSLAFRATLRDLSIGVGG